MIRSTLGAPLGGTTRGGHHGLESVALSLITPPNFGAGDGICFPLIVVVASAAPKVPVTCWAEAALPPPKKVATASAPRVSFRKLAPKSIFSLLTSNSRLASQGDGCDARVACPMSGRYPSRMNRSSTPQCDVKVSQSLSRHPHKIKFKLA